MVRALLYRVRALLYMVRALLYRVRALLYMVRALLYMVRALLYMVRALLYRVRALLYIVRALLYRVSRVILTLLVGSTFPVLSSSQRPCCVCSHPRISRETTSLESVYPPPLPRLMEGSFTRDPVINTCSCGLGLQGPGAVVISSRIVLSRMFLPARINPWIFL
jgi:hypothetical protein